MACTSKLPPVLVCKPGYGHHTRCFEFDDAADAAAGHTDNLSSHLLALMDHERAATVYN